MNKQNLLSPKYLISYYVSYFLKTLARFLLLVCVIFGLFYGYSELLNYRSKSVTEKLGTTLETKEEYNKGLDELTTLRNQSNLIKAQLENIMELQGDYAKFNVFLSYLVNLKPYNVILLSVEDIMVTPSSEEILNDTGNNSESVISNDITGEVIVSNIDGAVDTENTNVDTGGHFFNDSSIVEEETVQDRGMNWNNERLEDTLIYSHDVGTTYVIMRGYSDDALAISEYIDIISDAPEIRGYAIEGINNKITHIENTNLILFELKIAMKGV